MATIQVSREWVESISRLRLPRKVDHRLRALMDGNTEGQLAESERAGLEALVELSETLSLVRAEALRLLGLTPR